MANSFQEQLLKAGLVTQEQIEKANQPKPKPVEKTPNKNRNTAKPRPNPVPRPQTNPQPVKAAKPPKSQSDLEQFYKERAQLERNEREETERLARERAARKKQTREQVHALIQGHVQNVDDAEIRYNFVVGDNIKYVYVTEAQQQALADGTLAITFLEGKRCLISSEIAAQLLVLDPGKLVILNHPDDTAAA
ncbi:DUF2058 family protein [Candidatus Thiothrix anitrata]|uniref:DUF2058 family protein n=1 Tax=Candidatus Thiothrix anitrata TaxID=2823902 RepID=A0ABX7X559_9GAMM|nr:DUF2058 family protein [Candidatus Thiothrix anitrata]QTR50489.1 DUF2058 family protein [Candidatus Thiothrix anitrata]QTR50502.1 DUF2058 family protein [Candidatus Thiothrix anitrata]